MFVQYACKMLDCADCKHIYMLNTYLDTRIAGLAYQKGTGNMEYWSKKHIPLIVKSSANNISQRIIFSLYYNSKSFDNKIPSYLDV